jgi:ATP-dependent Clp protease ATP-binding subunit ClpX
MKNNDKLNNNNDAIKNSAKNEEKSTSKGKTQDIKSSKYFDIQDFLPAFDEKEAENKMDDSDGDFLKDRVNAIPLMSPKNIFSELEKYGYRGQKRSRIAVTLMAYRHIRRLKRLYVEGVNREDIAKKNNLLLLGPTGCGKTFLVELLFGKILKLPTVIVDVTPFSETGYVGQDPNNILTRLYHTADRDERLTRIGIICLDEFDKLASNQNNAVFAGAGTTKDITGLGVQRELLKMLESNEVNIPVELTHSSYVETLPIFTGDIAFVGVGAFSGFSAILNKFAKGKISGFSKIENENRRWEQNAIAVSYEPEDVEKVSYFQTYGFLPELVARFGQIVPFSALSKDTMRDILNSQVIDKTVEEFRLEGIELIITPDVVEHIVELALKRETGARGLTSLIFRYLEEQAFELFGEKQGVTLKTYLDGNKIKSKIV